MPITANDDFNPKKVYDDLIKRAKEAKEWYIYCYVEEEWFPKGESFPFDMTIKDGVFTCKVIASTHREAMLKVVDNVPVIKFLDELED